MVKIHIPAGLHTSVMIESGDSEGKPVGSSQYESLSEIVAPNSLSEGTAIEIDEGISREDMPGAGGETRPPPSDFGEPESTEVAFRVNLEFPGQDRPRMSYEVYFGMPVRLLYRAIASGVLGCEDNQIRIYVDGQRLLHLGTITNRHFPDLPEVPSVFLSPSCAAQVRRIGTAQGDTAIPPLPPDEKE